MHYSEEQLPTILLQKLPNPAAAKWTKGTSQADLAGGTIVSGGESGEFFDAVNVDEAMELYSAVRDLAPENSAEIGFCCGGSGLAILKALEDNGRGMHHVCDPYQTSYAGSRGRRNVELAKLSHRMNFHERFPEEVFSTLPSLGFAFIDASHLFDLTILDFVLVDKRLEVGGVVGFHDLWMPSLQKVVRCILTNRDYEIYHPPTNTVATSHKARPALRNSVAGILSSIAGRLPRAEKVFSSNLLHPWASYGFSNIALLRKLKNDTRGWQHHVSF